MRAASTPFGRLGGGCLLQEFLRIDIAFIRLFVELNYQLLF